MSMGVDPQHKKQHPLVGDLVDYSDGIAGEASRAWIVEHLKECDRCVEILSGVQDDIAGIDPSGWLPTSVPAGVVALLGEQAEDDPKPSELWLLDWDHTAALGRCADS